MPSCRQCLAVALALAGAAVAASTEAPPAPAPAAPPPSARKPGDLLESKQALRQLQREQVLKRNAEAAGTEVTAALPHLETPTPGAPPAISYVPPSERAADAAKAKAEKQANWLVNGVEQLRRESQQGRDGRNGSKKDDLAAGEEAASGEEAAQDGAAGRETMPARTDRKLLAGVADPMAPFMKEWLASSPVDQKVFAGILGRNAGETAAPRGLIGGDAALNRPGGNAPLRPSDSNVIGTLTGGEPANPFLEALSPQVQPLLPGAANSPVPAPSATGPATPVPASLAVPEMLSPPLAADRKPPASVDKDNRKYFPQQRRF